MLDHHPTAACIRGEFWQASVPDTLDLAERMALAVNALTGVWNPDERWSLAFKLDFSRRPPVSVTNHLTDAYLNIPPKFIEALVLCRLASGSDLNLGVDEGVIGSQLSLLGEDGLTYCPNDALPGLEGPRDYAEIWGEGRSLVALCMLAQVDGDPLWVRVARRKVDRLLSLSRPRDGFRFFWRGRFLPGQSVPDAAGEPAGGIEDGSLLDRYDDPRMSIIYSVGALGHGSALLYRLTGYEPALELARGLARWALARVFDDPDGRWQIYHFHHSLYALLAVCEYAIAAGDGEALARVDACYRWAREMGDPLIGYYTEWMPGSDLYLQWPSGPTTEICEVADMVFLALALTRAGAGDYWDDVDRWTRNVFAEGQLLDTDCLERLPASYFDREPGPEAYVDDRDVAARGLGSFFGWMRANDGFRVEHTPDGPRLPRSGIMHCCTANGARTLYSVWDSVLGRDGDTVTVDLLLNRASPWLDIDSYLPVDGRVVLHVKDAPCVAVRLPPWCDPQQATVAVGGDAFAALADGPLLLLDGLDPGDEVTISFPVPERTLHRVIGEIPYKLRMRGSNVVSIDPGGVAYPLYEHQPHGKPVTKTRFVPAVRDVIW